MTTSNNLRVIGVAGTNGSGKDTVMRFLADNYGYLFVSATDLLTAELELRGEPTDREHKSTLSAEWRREGGMGVIVQKAYEAWQRHPEKFTGVVVGSLRHPGEADKIHEYGGTVLWVDADQLVRYERIQANLASRGGRAAEDAISFEQFKNEEAREMHPTGDAATLDMASVKERADIFLDNGGDELTKFQGSIKERLGL